MTALIAINDLTLALTGSARPLVSGISFSIAAGERLGLIGESGSGKSLTAMAAVGLLPPQIKASGSVILASTQVVDAHPRSLDRLRGQAAAVVFQEPLTALDPLMRIGAQIAEPLERRLRRQNQRPAGRAVYRGVINLLEQVALPDPERLLKAYPHEISGGQRQRAAIAMALACEPQLLIADEPTTALDVTTQAEILKLLDNLVRERDMALLFISHDLPVVAGIVDRVVVLRKGEAVEAGPARTVLTQPQHDYTKSLVAAAAAFDTALAGEAE